MKNTIWIILLLTNFNRFAFGQTDSIISSTKIDTFETHYHSITWQSSNGKFTYYENGTIISKAKYDALSKEIIDPNICKPCYLIAYQNNKLIYEGDFYTDCGVGRYIDYFPNGTIKTKGEYVKNLNQNWDTNKVSEWCSIKTGLWQYFDENGVLKEDVVYLNGFPINK